MGSENERGEEEHDAHTVEQVPEICERSESEAKAVTLETPGRPEDLIFNTRSLSLMTMEEGSSATTERGRGNPY